MAKGLAIGLERGFVVSKIEERSWKQSTARNN